MQKDKTQKKLDVKVRLLINQMDMYYRISLDKTKGEKSRKKGIDAIIGTYSKVITPFITDESEEYQDKIVARVIEVQNKLKEEVDLGVNIESKLSKIQLHLKDMLTTRRTRVERIMEVLECNL